MNITESTTLTNYSEAATNDIGKTNGNQENEHNDADSRDVFALEMCRVCLCTKRPLVSLFFYRPTGSYAELLTTLANVQVSVNDGYVDKICNKCANFLDKAIKFKKVAEDSDRRLRAKRNQVMKKNLPKQIKFNCYNDIKNEIGSVNIKTESNVKVEVEVLDVNTLPANMENGSTNNIVICNTIIKKIDPSTNIAKRLELPDVTEPAPDISWNSIKKDELDYTNFYDSDFNDGGDFANDSDDDYIPLSICKKQKFKKTKLKTKFKRPKLSEVKVFKEKKRKSSISISSKLPAVGNIEIKNETTEENKLADTSFNTDDNSTYITCFSITRNGKKGPPLVLKRPKDSTILKRHPNYKPRDTSYKKSGRQYRENDTINVPREVCRNNIKPREKLVCPICGVLTYGLGNHIATHSEKKRYPCPQCNRTFAQKNNMLIHLKTHSGVKDHICEVCGAGFYCQKSLLRHNLIHKGERPYGCTLCSKRFIARCDLTRHLRIHAGYKPFKCNECAMSFNAKHQLQNHERMHTGEKPYSCEVCNVSFSYKVNLNNHVYKVHGINLKFKSIHTITDEVLKDNTLIAMNRSDLVPILVEPDERIPPTQHHYQ